MTPTEIRGAITHLVAAGAKATPGRWKRFVAARGAASQVVLESDESVKIAGRTVRTAHDARFIASAANARPALSALAGMCVLPVEVVRVLVEAMRVVARAEGLSLVWSAALAAAEAEVARVEGR